MKILLVSIIIFIFGLLDFLNPVQNFFHQVTAPISFGLRRSAIDIKQTCNLFYKVNDIRKENLKFRNDLNELRGLVINLTQAQEENELLRTQLDLKNDKTFDRDLLLASVMGNPQDLTGTSLILDKGSRHGVTVDNNVILGSFLVGKIASVTAERSVVTLITSPDISFTVKNVSSNAEGVAQGNLGTSIVVNRLLPGEEVAINSIFITSGKDGNFLSELGVGVVVEVSFESAEPLKSAILAPLVNFESLEKVFVVLH